MRSRGEISGEVGTLIRDPQFTHRNEGFECVACGASVPPASRSCRNHCPRCLTSRHVDVAPGDRAADCGGIMDPMGYELKDGGRKITIHHQCRVCGYRSTNVAAIQDRAWADDYEKILGLGPVVDGP